MASNGPPMATILKVLGCVTGVVGALLIYGVLQERIMTRPYGEGDDAERFTFSVFLVMNNRCVSMIVAALVLALKRGLVSPVAPIYSYAAVSGSNVVATTCQYEALKYVSFPVQTLGKCAKMIPVMIWGYAINGKTYKLADYLIACGVMTGCTLFAMYGETTSSSAEGPSTGVYGIALMLGYLGFDGFTSTFQDKLFKGYQMETYNQMLWVNFCSAIISSFWLFSDSSMGAAIQFIKDHPEALNDVLILSAASTCGQLCMPAHERFCMSCRSPPCSLVPENQELARQLADVNNAHRNCPTDLENLRSDVSALQEAHKDCASNYQALSAKHSELTKAHAPCAKTIEELEAIAHEHANCGNRILGTVDDLNDKKSELKDTQGALHKTQTDLSELTTNFEEMSSEHEQCKKDLGTLNALKDSMDQCVKNCIEFKPSVGLQFVELPGDGIAVKYAPEALPAYQSGVRNNDMILESNGRLVFSKQDFKRTLEDCVGGDVVPLLIRRGRGNTVVNLTVGAEGYSLEEVRRNRLCADWHDPSWRSSATKFGFIEQRIGEGSATPARMGSRTFQKNP